jgi:hypothetical protein
LASDFVARGLRTESLLDRTGERRRKCAGDALSVPNFGHYPMMAVAVQPFFPDCADAVGSNFLDAEFRKRRFAPQQRSCN